jgi:exopolyphosphatase/guanosine-5'-triphosphate,3'-diphosphate pyrophosphatase
MRVAALDLGTNTFLCLIVEGDSSGIHSVLSDQAKVVRLGQGLANSGTFHPEALVRARECLTSFKHDIDKYKVDRILAMATSAARDATNGEELFKIGQELGIPIEIIPGADEARITFAGATEGMKNEQAIAVIDVGGGSTEFILGMKAKIDFAQSLNVGCVRLTEKAITKQPISNSERQTVESVIDTELEKVIREMSARPIDEIVAVAGTPTSLAASEIGYFDPEKVQGFVLSEEKLKKWCDILASTTTEEKIQKYKIEAGRADVLFVGATLLHRFLVKMKKPSMKVSIKGVRYGVALEALSRP